MNHSVAKNNSNSIEPGSLFTQVKHNPKILKIINSIAMPFAAGTFYYFIHHQYQTNFTFVSDSLKTVLGYDEHDFTPDFLFEILHADDVVKMGEKQKKSFSFLSNEIPVEDIPSYKVVYLLRLKHANGKYKTILHQVRPLNVSEDGEILETIVVHTDVSYLNIPVDHKISFISREKKSFFALDAVEDQVIQKNNCEKILSPREMEILKCLSKGMNIEKIADILFLSVHTINTHKKNIIRKTKSKNITEVVARCIREGVI